MHLSAPPRSPVRGRLAPSTFMKLLMPVTFPAGRLRLATKPTLTGSSPMTKTIGIVSVAALAARAPGNVCVAMTAGPRLTRSVASRGQSVKLTSRQAILEDYVLTLEKPPSRRPCRKASASGSKPSAVPPPRKPISVSRVAARAPSTATMPCRRLRRIARTASFQSPAIRASILAIQFHIRKGSVMSALGQKQTFAPQ